MTDTILLTDHSPFYRAVNDGETRFYPQTKTNGKNRALAQEFDTAGDPPIVMGYAVYDTSISTVYAVALYATSDEAAAHTPATPDTPPTDVFAANNPSTDADAPTTEAPEPSPKKSKTKKSKNPFRK